MPEAKRPPFNVLFHAASAQKVDIGGGLTFEAMPSNPNFFGGKLPIPPVGIALTPTEGNGFKSEQTRKLNAYHPKLVVENLFSDADGKLHAVMSGSLQGDEDVYGGGYWAPKLKAEFGLSDEKIMELLKAVAAARKAGTKEILWVKPTQDRALG